MNDIDEIKNRIDIVDLISTYLTVKKAGANYRAICPFHNEKTPSLMISPEKQIWHCFGCNSGGDVFSFIMQMENLEFREALEMLAARAGVKLKNRSSRPSTTLASRDDNNNVIASEAKQSIDRKTRLFRVNSVCAQVYHKILMTHPSGKIALDYLHHRGITDQTIKVFMIGYAPSSRAIKSYLNKKSFTESEIQNAGGPDRFYKRIIFPITDVMGNVLGFTGRTIDKNIEPKYLNTPETIIFHKSRILYNLTRARGEIKITNNTVVVEGQMDVISSHQAGVKNVVATSGTALTPDHLKILYRYTPNITFAFDSDSAGLATSKKAYEMALEEGFNVRLVNLGEFKDPGEVIEKDASLWPKIIAEAKPAIEWYFDLAFKKNVIASDSEAIFKDGLPRRSASRNDNRELTSLQKKEIAQEILPIIKKIPDTIEQADYIGKLAQRLEISEQIIFDAMNKAKNEPENRKNAEKSLSDKIQLTPEEIFLAILIKNPRKFAKNIEKIELLKSHSDSREILRLTPQDDITQKIYKIIKKWYNDNKDADLMKIIKSSLTIEEFDKLQILLLEIEEKYPINLEEVVRDVVSKINSDSKEKIKAQFAKNIAIAEKEGDHQKLKQLIKDFQEAIK